MFIDFADYTVLNIRAFHECREIVYTIFASFPRESSAKEFPTWNDAFTRFFAAGKFANNVFKWELLNRIFRNNTSGFVFLRSIGGNFSAEERIRDFINK